VRIIAMAHLLLLAACGNAIDDQLAGAIADVAAAEKELEEARSHQLELSNRWSEQNSRLSAASASTTALRIIAASGICGRQ